MQSVTGVELGNVEQTRAFRAADRRVHRVHAAVAICEYGARYQALHLAAAGEGFKVATSLGAGCAVGGVWRLTIRSMPTATPLLNSSI